MTSMASGAGGRGGASEFTLGLLLAFGVVLLIGEVFARLSPPRDIPEQMGQAPTQKRIYRSDPELGVDYGSYEDFRAAHAMSLDRLGPLDSPRPTWLLFGNSFVQADGMIAETAARLLPGKRMFALRENIILPLRAAQARHLLHAGLRPQRIFFVILPVDLYHLGRQAWSSIDVNADGAITRRVRWLGPPWDDLVAVSHLATIAWMRSRRVDGDRSFEAAVSPSSPVREDVSRIVNHLATTSRRFNVPITVVILPNREQVFDASLRGFQNALREITQQAQLDFYDASDLLAAAADKRSLFLPDWHFTERGNVLVVQGLIEHLRAQNAL